MKSLRLFFCVCLVLVLCVVATGCTAIGIDVENQLRPPNNNGDQEELQRALDNYIALQYDKGENSGYTLKYPTEGHYRSAFILLDQVTSPTYIAAETISQSTKTVETLQNYCLAFYRMDLENSVTRIHLLKKERNQWVSIADIEGYSEEIAQVAFADLDGNGFPELLLGWNMYNTKDKRLTIHSLESNLSTLFEQLTYTTLVTGDLTADSADDLLLLNISTGSRVYARLFSLQEQKLVKLGQADMDSDIQHFDLPLLTIFADSTRGVFIDAHKDPATTITELILWKNDELQTPFCNKKNFITTDTARVVNIACRDIDQDGNVEWPLITQLSGQETLTADTKLMKTSWYSYDAISETVKHEFDSVTNIEDSYSLELNDNWPTDFSAEYDLETRLLTFTETDTTPFLKIQTTTSNDKNALAPDLIYFDESESYHYAIWYSDALNMSMEEIRYSFSIL